MTKELENVLIEIKKKDWYISSRQCQYLCRDNVVEGRVFLILPQLALQPISSRAKTIIGIVPHSLYVEWNHFTRVYVVGCR